MLVENIKSSWREITKWSMHSVLILSILSGVNTILLFAILWNPTNLSCAILIIIGYVVASYCLYLSFATRTRGISVRKVLGAGNIELFRLVTTEAFIYMLASGLIAVVIVEQVANFLIPLPAMNLEYLIKYVVALFTMSLIISLFPYIKLSLVNPINTFRSSEPKD